MRYFHFPIKAFLLLLSFSFSGQLLAWPGTNERPIVIHTYSAGLKEYDLFRRGRDIEDIANYTMSEDITRRVILEMILMEQALSLGGFDRPVRYQNISDDLGNIFKLLKEGKFISHTDSFWRNDILSHDYIQASEPLLRDGEYVVGLYTSPDNFFALNSTAENINRLSAVSNKQWSADWLALEELSLKKLKHIRHWRMMAAMVQKRDVDFMLVPFQGTKDHSMGRGDHRLIPIPGIKLTLHDSRHLAISKTHSSFKSFNRALSKGLKILRENGTLARAYREAGVIDQRVDDWHLLNPSEEIPVGPSD